MPPAPITPTPLTPAHGTTAASAVERWTWATMMGAIALCGAVAWELADPDQGLHTAGGGAVLSAGEPRIVGVLSICAVLLGGLSIASWRSGRRARDASNALNESERRLRMVGDNLPDTYLYQYLHEADGTPRFTFISAGAARVHGVPLEVILAGPGNLLAAALSPEQAAAMAALEVRSAREQTDFDLDLDFLRGDGEPRILHLRSRPSRLPDGRTQWDGIAVDVTERRRNQAAIWAANARYARQEAALTSLTRTCALGRMPLPALLAEITRVTADTLDADHVSIWQADEARGALTCHEAYDRRRYLHTQGQVSVQDAVGASFRAVAAADVHASSGELGPGPMRDLTARLFPGVPVQGLLTAPVHRTGGGAGLLAVASRQPRGAWTADEQAFAIAVANIVAWLVEMTERQGVEARLRHAQKLEAIGQLAGGVAHDFNNILAAMMMQTELVASLPGLPAEARDGLSELRQATDRAANLTRQMLLFSRRQVMQPRVVDVNEVVRSLAKMLERLIGEDVRLVQRLAAAPLRTLADPGMLDQVLMNLAINARDAMPGGGTLTLSTASIVIDAARARTHPPATAGRFVCISLMDTGVGIAPEHLQHIFEPFFTTKPAGKGTGLGLATAFGIVTQHRGWLEVHTEVGRGTTFDVYLPLSGEATPVPTRNSAPPVARGQQETLLLVEDEPGVRGVAVAVLTRHGYRVLEATDGPQAFALWRAHRDEIDLLVTDMVMPGGLTGRQLAEAIRRESPDLRVVYMSGYSPDEAGGEFVLGPGEHFLPKPFGPRPLLEMVRAALGHEPTPA